MTPTARTLAALRKFGWTAQVVERWNPHYHTRLDLFGCIDIVATNGMVIMGVQATSGANHAARITKARAEPRLRTWLAAGGLFVVESWSKTGARGKRKLWTRRIEALVLSDMCTGTSPA